MVTRTESMNFVTSCHQVESCVVSAPVNDVWQAIRGFEFAKIFPSSVKNVAFKNGNVDTVESLFEVEYLDGSVWTYRIIEISDYRRVVIFELVSAQPQTTFHSLINTFRLYRVTDTNATYLSWESDFSNDIDSHVIQDAKFKKLDSFKDLKKVFSN